jgi:hypothetical protein
MVAFSMRHEAPLVTVRMSTLEQAGQAEKEVNV